jgi:hypothetical protein
MFLLHHSATLGFVCRATIPRLGRRSGHWQCVGRIAGCKAEFAKFGGPIEEVI